MQNESHEVSHQSEPPLDAVGEDPGQRAMEEYRAWRRRHMGSDRMPRIPSLIDLLAGMREDETKGEGVEP